VDTKTNRLQHVFIRDEREPKNELTYVAQEAEIVPVKTNSEYSSAILLQLYRGSSHHQDLEHHLYERTDFEAYHLYLRINEGSGDASMRPRMIPQKQLETFVKDNPPTTHVGREFRGEYWRRYSTAITPLIFLFLGIGFGTSHHRSAKMGAVLIGLLLSVLYWALQTIDFFLLDHHILNPFWALQLPNIILLIIGLWRYRYALK
jgi:lipopolysaccharide export LptBFGC system permease protein LptF